MSRRKIYFFSNGVTIISDEPGAYRESPKPWPALFDGSTCEFQVPWIRVFADFLVSKGEEPSHFELHFPDGRTGWIFWNDDPDCYDPPGNWSWKITDPA
jgi:hypothetical protein